MTDAKTPSPDANAAAEPVLIAESKVKHIPIAKLDLDDTTFMFRAALRIGPLKKTLQSEGQHVPIVVRKLGSRRRKPYQIISGFRRATAMKALKKEKIAAIVRTDLPDDESAFKAAVVENEQRKTYSDIDRALVIHAHEKAGYSSVEVAELMGLRKRQKNYLKNLLELPQVVRDAVDDPDVPFYATHGITLRQMAARYPDLDYEKWVERVIEDELSVARLKRAVNKEHRPTEPVPIGSIFNDGATDKGSGVYRLAPVKIVVSDLDDQEKQRLKAELAEVMEALG